ncbi:PREDICTED: pentatricopeptide repeat-containing protein At2g29760, chloroplastic-like [Nelumbo nucifera]|uniref:DYW domain-containing protein n=2 Tax=Nelumbo nucifera TaxID=4432 RepID=A0A822YC47_NELNU|nr:PREDICTED: pentatricopeptide repeat-containing protein At2g29760, chloroplastic-like [Nelumbo nucifera]DAD28646.1 TPA_asm: hypothetical protein HUJ06_030114 [Nelumbo nucifera]
MLGLLSPKLPSVSHPSLADARKPLTETLQKRPLLSSSKRGAKRTDISRNPFDWNTRFRAYIDKNQHEEVLLLYLSMVTGGVPPDEFTFPLVLKACSALEKIREGKQLHAHVVKNGFLFSENVFVQNSILHMYASCGCLEIARLAFEKMTQRTLVSWNSLISGYSRFGGYGFQAILLFVLMLKQGFVPDEFCFTVLLRACVSALAVEEAIQVHSHIIKLRFESNVLIQNSLMDMYVKFGLVEAALLLFNRMTKKDLVSWNSMITGLIRSGDLVSAEVLFNQMDVKNVVSWNTMISGYVQNGQCNEALVLFRKMQLEGVNPNSITVVSALSACSDVGALSLGKWIHSYCKRKGLIGSNEIVSAALVNMYAKCGDIETAHQVFESMVTRDIVSWDVMIEGFALHGRGEDALKLFRNMIREGVKPDEITLIGVLNACSHAGLVEEGLMHFQKMWVKFGVDPNLEHFTCVVDLLGRAGRLGEALQVIKGMNIAPDAVVWSVLLNACRIHGNVHLAEFVAKKIMELDPESSLNYVLLSNIYASNNKWEDASKVRMIMKCNDIEKEPGCSLIEIGGLINEFLAGDSSHPQYKQIFQKLEELKKKIKMAGYVPDMDMVLREIRDEEKESALYLHSEKLAVALGLINSPPGIPIRIVKNLRICRDCHSAIKLIAQIEGREIVVRDRNRFHHFKEGKCSCRDYW